ncbi:Non-specific serine/threonine protein kinase [Sulfidibacter corallicola]|uniref:Serine/threonine protein kinase n=1 Tax=Sulfidibacter corallicola TaxID=2818388 RepID=A0A8A4TKU2_SULCO|nr:serine/threonine-protein kinase [Sulfidibacter corallicola]QTD50097.1 serine/threonine protein kinase [Sulfidibacter corallicola]
MNTDANKSHLPPSRWMKIKEIVADALDKPEPDRAAFIERACEGDRDLQREVGELVFLDEWDPRIWESPLSSGCPEGGAPPLFSMASETFIGKQIGSYRLVRELGTGGMGHVFLAARIDAEYRAQVAIKILKPGMGSAEILARFRRERQISADLDHPNIARLFEGGTTPNGLPYFVMEYVVGVPITRYCREQALGVKARLRLFRKVCLAVQEAHQNLIIHRDIKPGNILVKDDGEPKLLDFGIAKVLDADATDASSHTRTGQRFFTPRYASPEQVRGDTLTTASDVYSLGVLLYELLTGQCPPIRPSADGDNATSAREGEPVKPSTVLERDPKAEHGADPLGSVSPKHRRHWKRELQGDLDTIVLCALRDDPHRRYGSAAQLGDDLARHLSGRPISARPESWSYLSAKFVKRHRVGVAITVSSFLILVTAVFGLWRQRDMLKHQRTEARALKVIAEDERDHAQAISRFLVDSFVGADPYERRTKAASLEEILDDARWRLLADTELKPLVRAELCHELGNVLNNLGQFEPAEAMMLESLELRRDHGASDRKIGESLEILASLDLARGQYSAGIARYEESHRLYGTLNRENAHAIAANRIRLGLTHNLTQDYRSAEASLRRAMDIFGRHPTTETNHLAYGCAELAMALMGQGKLSEVPSLIDRAEAIEAELREPRPALRASIWFYRGMYLRCTGRVDEAVALQRSVLATYRDQFGAQHWRIGQVLHEMARCAWTQGEWNMGDRHQATALEILRQTFPSTHRLVIDGALLKVDFWEQSGRLPRALTELEALVATYRQRLPEDQALFGALAHALGFHYLRLDYNREAAAIYEHLVPAMITSMGANDTRIAAARHNWAVACRRLGQFEKAAHIYRDLDKAPPDNLLSRLIYELGKADLALANGDRSGHESQVAAITVRLSDLDPESAVLLEWRLLSSRSRGAHARGNLIEAGELLDRALFVPVPTSDPLEVRSVRLMLRRIRLHLELNQQSEALAKSESLLDQCLPFFANETPLFRQVLAIRVESLRLANRFDEARTLEARFSTE